MLKKVLLWCFHEEERNFWIKTLSSALVPQEDTWLKKNAFNFGVRIWVILGKNYYGDSKLGIQSIWVIYKVEVAGHSKL